MFRANMASEIENQSVALAAAVLQYTCCCWLTADDLAVVASSVIGPSSLVMEHFNICRQRRDRPHQDKVHGGAP